MIKIRRIVCPTDFSPTAQHACEYAAELARSFGAEVVLLHVIPEMNYPQKSLGMVTAFPNLRQELEQRAKAELDGQRKLFDANVKVRTELRDGQSHEQILDCANAVKADLIVIGTHGHTGLKHMLLGSTAERVVRLATCPVMTVRKPD
ncbi:MAG: universal stress protein [Planctomycetota bacterium]|nr:universal stress protein [Planctomycetota bacterium]